MRYSDETVLRPLTCCACLPSGRRDVVVSVVRHMNEVTLHQARLVLGWVTVCGRVYSLCVYLADYVNSACGPPGSLNRVPA